MNQINLTREGEKKTNCLVFKASFLYLLDKPMTWASIQGG